ncbi:DNA mismatch repair protein MSH7 [Vitis vinifera]|uniref:DNA mismatch repair protein MSH7 n=1 Tax=Vitis vinifera TaxID=29760 RepID=A0A438EIP6_VITVI|nr:DNA mismatch repair protein MSH7 [Vitis vinifera]
MTKYGMASSQVSSVTSPESGGRSEIPNLGGNDSSPILITGHKLNGHNYLQWSQSVLLFICGKGKDERKFLAVWDCKDIWDAAKETYSSSENTSELFQVESALHDFRQGEQSVTQYYNTLTRYWQQLDLFETHSWKCSDDAATYRQIVEQKRLFKFFLGLNRELDDVRGRIMGIKPLPSLREAFSEVRREESRKKVMMGSKEQPAPTLDASALAARSFNSSGGDRQKRDRPWCDYCKKPGHYKETCWKLHGKPADWNQSHGLTEMAEHTTTGVAFTANRGGMRPWIVDTGASDHMTGDAAILQNYKPSNGHSSVHIADGSKSKIAGTGSIKLTKDLYLDSVLHDLKSGKMIGSAELCSGLYLLSCGQFSNQVSQASCVQSQKSPNPSQFAPTELSTPMPPSVQPAQHTNVPSPVTIQSPMPIQPIAPQLANENLQVYIRRRKRQELEHGSQSTCGQYIDSNSSLPEENIGEDRAGEVLIPSIDDSTLPIALRKGVRRCTDHPIGNYVTYEGLSPSYRAFATSLDDTQVPNTIQEALKISEWKKAVQDEIDALEKNGTWTITDLPVGKRPGDYQETFAPVAKLNTIRILLSLTVNQDWCLQQLDIKNAFSKWGPRRGSLHGNTTWFRRKYGKESGLQTPKIIVRLKQSPRAWFDRFTKAVLKLGYKQGQADHTLFVRNLMPGKLAILIVYVDDIILSGNDMGESRKGIVVSQRKYILDLLKETGMLGCKPIDTPMDSQKKLGIEKERNIIDRRSTSGYCSFVWGNLVTWRSKKQSVVARSSAEAEYRALAQGICSYKHRQRTPCIMTGPSMLELTDTLSQRRNSSKSKYITFLIIVAQVKVFGLLVKGLRVAIDLLVRLQKEGHIMPSLSEVLKLPMLSGSSGVDKLLTQFEAAIDSDFPNYENHDVTDSDAEILSILIELFIEKTTQWLQVIHAINHIDVLRSFAVIANFSCGAMSRPVILPHSEPATLSGETRGPLLKIRDGNHPRTLLLTGPNMVENQTLLRATCLAVILAQLGSYVPCKMCILSLVDVVFTRLGATDRIMTGESTFFIECTETASVLRNATQDSLVLLDELGRGTSTFDGYAIAYAVFRHLVEKVNCRLLFATHYHPLTKEFASHPHVTLQHMACTFNLKGEKSSGGEQELVFFTSLHPEHAQRVMDYKWHSWLGPKRGG